VNQHYKTGSPAHVSWKSGLPAFAKAMAGQGRLNRTAGSHREKRVHKIAASFFIPLFFPSILKFFFSIFTWNISKISLCF
jgi:hypothetical protein